MNGIDLKMTTEDAVRAIGEETKTSIDRIRRTGEALAEELSASFAERSRQVIPRSKLATAAVAAIIDFPWQAWTGSDQQRTQMQLGFNGQGAGSVDLMRGMAKGLYRAVITIERIGDLE